MVPPAVFMVIAMAIGSMKRDHSILKQRAQFGALTPRHCCAFSDEVLVCGFAFCEFPVFTPATARVELRVQGW
jgi:hypothetical protein